MNDPRREQLTTQPLRNSAQNSPRPARLIATLFAIPKPFSDPHIALIQSNAIRSWLELGSSIEVVLCGDEPGLSEFCGQHGIRQLTNIERNAQGTPLVSHAFRQVRETSDSPLLIYCNADVIFMRDLTIAVERMAEDNRFASAIAFGRRTELKVGESFDLSQRAEVQRLLLEVQRRGRRGPRICKEYFVVPADFTIGMPDLAVGRGNWDNWMVASAHRNGLPVIDLSECVTAVHQDHDYSHVGASRLSCYLTGPEARENQRQAGGRNWIRGTSAGWTMTPSEIRRKGWAWLSADFWQDLPAFAAMAVRLPWQK